MNPELRRMLWLEVSSQRLWLIPAAIIGSTLLLEQSGAGPTFLRTLALLAFVLLTLIWGARQAANAVLDEARERTWEIQRMSALRPWPMTWGKLVGATLLPWYAGLMCLVIFVTHNEAEAIDQAFGWALFAVLLALLAQASALTVALAGMHLARRLRRRMNIALVLFLLALLLPELAALTVPGFGPLRDIGEHVSWYGRSYDGIAFNLVFVSSLAIWAIIAAYRMMCLELDVRTTPWVWLAFICFLSVCVSGFDTGVVAASLVRRWCSTAAACACVLSYVAAFAFTRDPVQYRRVWQALREGRYRRALEDLPLWVSSATCTLVFAIIAFLLGSDSGVNNEQLGNLGPVALALALFMVRDLLLLASLSFQQRERRAEVTTLIYLALLNRVIPATLVLMGAGQVAQLFKPTLFDKPLLAIVIASVHVLIALGFFRFAYRSTLPVVGGQTR